MPVSRFTIKEKGRDKELAKRNEEIIFKLSKKRKETQSQRRFFLSGNADTEKLKARAKTPSGMRQSLSRSIKKPVKFIEDSKEIKEYHETGSTAYKEKRKDFSQCSKDSAYLTSKGPTPDCSKENREFLYEGRKLSMLSRSSYGVTPSASQRTSFSKKYSLPSALETVSFSSLKRKRISLDEPMLPPKRLHPKNDNF
ncbi:unnamed protein product [Blepharisma stoltei]|uniref:Uncharacterized protein n=1 Tax=Blepharisma stoltei TaxID=1481888 RepID=A0AAU9J5P6_9CILI|nr:unnamed protein product [Blepharisma stoltei]